MTDLDFLLYFEKGHGSTDLFIVVGIDALVGQADERFREPLTEAVLVVLDRVVHDPQRVISVRVSHTRVVITRSVHCLIARLVHDGDDLLRRLRSWWCCDDMLLLLLYGWRRCGYHGDIIDGRGWLLNYHLSIRSLLGGEGKQKHSS